MTARGSESGFSLIETLVTMILVSVLMLGAMTLFDGARRVTTTQTGVADVQGNLRVASYEVTRMLNHAGVGGLPESIPPALAAGSAAGVFPRGLAMAVVNNVADGTRIGDSSTPIVVSGTDIATLRGVFSTPVYYLEPQVPLNLVGGRVPVVVESQVDVGVVQDLEPLREALTLAKAQGRQEAVIVRDRFNPGMYAVMELDLAATLPGNVGDANLTVGLILSDTAGDQAYANEYGRLTLGTTLLQGAGGSSVTLPDGTLVQLPSVVGSLGLLEEHRFFVREDWENDGDSTSRPTPRLARARFYPNTDVLHPEGVVDLVDGIVDLQLALGVDLPPRDGQVLDSGDDTDEVLYNHPGDDDGLSSPLSGDWGVPDAQVLFVRLNVVAQAKHPDPQFDGVVLGAFEDHDHVEPGDLSIFNLAPNHKVRKLHQQTLVEMRNMP